MFDTYSATVIIIIIALIFDFLNGFHDSANSIATVVVSKTLTPIQAVILAASANFIGFFTGGVAVAKMIGKGVVAVDNVTLSLLFATLLGAVIWNIITWYYGLPTSSSHALIGGLIGAGVASHGFKSIIIGSVLKIFAFIFIAPALGLIGAVIFTVIVLMFFRKSVPKTATAIFKRLQLASAFFCSYGHGINDAQKTMGIIALAMFVGGLTKEFSVQTWVIFSCHASIAIGTLLGGWRIVKTMGTSITKVGPMEGFCAETSSAVILIATSHFGIPVSTTHVIAGSIMGVGTVENIYNVRWITVRKILLAWIFTIPFTALCSAIAYLAIMWIE